MGEVSPGADEEEHHFLVRVLLDLPEPPLELLEGSGVVDGVEEVDCADAAVEGADDGAEELLAGLSGGTYTVSQICSRTVPAPSNSTFLEANSTPTVTLYSSENCPLM